VIEAVAAAGASDGALIVIEFMLSNQFSISHKSKRQWSKRVVKLCHRSQNFSSLLFLIFVNPHRDRQAPLEDNKRRSTISTLVDA
jgi:hypothetical protein